MDAWRLSTALQPAEFERLLSFGVERSVRGGTVLIEEGASDSILYWVRSGELAVRRKDHADEILLHADDIVGEMAFIDERPRSATVLAKTDARVVAVERKDVFGKLVNDPAGLGKLIGVLAQRMANRLAVSGAPASVKAHLDAKVIDVGETISNRPTDVDTWLAGVIDESINHRAVHHEYLKRLAAGDFPDIQWALRDYASRYYGYSAHFPRYLTAVISNLTRADHRKALMQNLLEESGHLGQEEKNALAALGIDPAWVDGIPHPVLFRSIQQKMGAAAFVEEDDDSLDVICWREAFFSTLAHGSAAEGIGALGLGTEGIVKHFYTYLVEAFKRFSGLTRKEYVFFELHCLVDDEHTAVLNGIARDLASDPEARRDLRKGMRKALNMRVSFWDWMLERALHPERVGK